MDRQNIVYKIEEMANGYVQGYIDTYLICRWKKKDEKREIEKTIGYMRFIYGLRHPPY